MNASDYLLLPYINYTRPLSLCVFAIAGMPEKTKDSEDNKPVITLGQRFLSKFPLMVVYDRDNQSGVMSLGGSDYNDDKNEF